LACVVALLFGATLLGQILGRKQNGIKRAVCWIVPPMVVAVAAISFAHHQLQAIMHSNELTAYTACLHFAEGEQVYHRTDWKKDGVHEYASSMKELFEKDLISREMSEAEWPSAKPYHGYYFKILKQRALSEDRSYFDLQNRMTKGYALAAWPAHYKRTGMYQFQISSAGSIYYSERFNPQRDGERTAEFYPAQPDWMATCGFPRP
jgi:hypothetical protein